MSVASAQSTLRNVCASFLAAALEAAAAAGDAGADPRGGVAASLQPPGDEGEGAPAEATPPASLPQVTLRLTEAAPAAHGDARALDSISVDALGCAWHWPDGVPALARALTGCAAGTPTREWAAALWRAGVQRVDARTAAPADLFARCFTYVVANELAAPPDAGGDARRWLLPLLPAANVPKPADCTDLTGFQFSLTFRSRAGAAPELPQPPPFTPALVDAMTVLVHATELLPAAADVHLELGTYEVSTHTQHDDEPATGCDAATRLADAPAAPTLHEAIAVTVRGCPATQLLAERQRAAVQAHWQRTELLQAGDGSSGDGAAALLQPHTSVRGDTPAERSAAGADSAAAAVADRGVVAVARAEQLSGTGNQAVRWTLTAVVASSSSALEQGDTDEGDLLGAAAHEAGVVCFGQSLWLTEPPAGVLDCLRAKVTAAEWKAAFGLRVGGCDTAAERQAAQAAAVPHGAAGQACAWLRFTPVANAPARVHPALVVLHRRCTSLAQAATGGGGGAAAGKLPALARKREAALVKAALGAALRDFATATGGGSAFQHEMKESHLPAVAAALAKILVAGAPELRRAAADMAQTRQELRLLPPAAEEDTGGGELTRGAVAQAVLDALLEALGSAAGGAAALGEDEPAAQQADASHAGADEDAVPATDDDDEDAVLGAEEELQETAPAHSWLLGVRAREPDAAADRASPVGADDIFPVVIATRRRVGASPPRVAPGVAAAAPPGDAGDDEGDGWFL